MELGFILDWWIFGGCPRHDISSRCYYYFGGTVVLVALADVDLCDGRHPDGVSISTMDMI